MSSAAGESTAAVAGRNNNEEDQLRNSLRQRLAQLNRREPLDPNYKRLILNGTVTSRRAVIPKDKFYRRVGSRLRERVEGFMALTEGKDPLDRLSQRQPLEEGPMRAALTLREAKEHEQQPLLDATLAALPRRNGMDEMTRKRHFEGIALTLQTREIKKTYKSPTLTAADLTESARQKADLERQRAQARVREAARKRREDEERQRREEEIVRKRKLEETPHQVQMNALHKVYSPIFKRLWDMEFSNLGGTNPFRIVIDKSNCVQMGAPDYCEIIKVPMNLTYIQKKVERVEYQSLQAFFDDVDLVISNAILYNSDAGNPYRVAAEDMKSRYSKFAKKIIQAVKEQQGNS